MKANVLRVITILGFSVMVGCETGKRDGKTVNEPQAYPRVSAFATTPGTVAVTNPGPAGTTGGGSVWVKWDSTQTTLQNCAKWTLKKKVTNTLTGPFDIEGIKPIPAGAYTVRFSTCSVAGYAPPTTSKVVNVSQGKTTLITVKYRH